MEFLLAAIMFVESGGDPNLIGAHGERGPFQIKRVYWNDACRQLLDEGMPAAQVPTNYDRWVRDPEVSMRIVRAYWRRFCPQAYHDLDWATLARVHNGGPGGDQKSTTADYWRRVERKMWRLESAARQASPPIMPVSASPSPLGEGAALAAGEGFKPTPSQTGSATAGLVPPCDSPATDLDSTTDERALYLSVFAAGACDQPPAAPQPARHAASHRSSAAFSARALNNFLSSAAPFAGAALLLCLGVSFLRSRREAAWNRA